MTKSEREDINVHVFFGNTNPETHPLWNSTIARELADSVVTHKDDPSANETSLSHLAELECSKDYHAKVTADFASALRHCYASPRKSPYIALFEDDDILISHGWVARLRSGLRTIEEYTGTEAGKMEK
jgi:hypothetical protein